MICSLQIRSALQAFFAEFAFRLSESTDCSLHFSGGYVVGVTPVPIPNTEVKPYGADGTARVTVWESRSPPGLIPQKARSKERASLFSDTLRLLVHSYPNALSIQPSIVVVHV